MLLSITSSKDGSEVTMHLDSAGLDKLIAQLELLKKMTDKGSCEHIHLMSESWGMNELTETMLQSERDAGHSQVFHLKVYTWDQEWRKKHEI